MKLPTDAYSLRARFLPSLLVLLPALLAVAAWFPLDELRWRALGSIGVFAAAGLLLSHFARDLGLAKQRELWRSWGGPPTTRLLRHRGSVLNPHTRQRYHDVLQKVVPGVRLPSPEEEAADPGAADQVYDSCTTWLREHTRDRARFGLLFEENVSYGFRRNLWAMKPAGIALAIFGMLACVGRLVAVMAEGTGPESSPEAMLGTVLSGSMLTWWCLRIGPSWVATAADAYAVRLLATCDTLGAATPQ